jgi:hypothetical protein
MRIVFEQTGGLMGRKTSLTLNLADLPASQADSLRLLLEQAGFITQTGPNAAASSARDQFNYQVTVETDDLQQSIRTGDASMPPGLRPLIDELSRLARTQKSG